MVKNIFHENNKFSGEKMHIQIGIANVPTWSMAQGMRQGMLTIPLRGTLKVQEKDGEACTAGNALFPILSDIVKPKIAFAFDTENNLMKRNFQFENINHSKNHLEIIKHR